MEDDDLIWTAGASGATLAAGMLTRKAMAKGWGKARGRVPGSDDGQETPLKEAIMWAIVSAVAVALVRLAAERGIANALAKRASNRT